MPNAEIGKLQHVFVSRLATLRHLLERGQAHFGAMAFLDRRLAADMHPLGTQVAFACNQPRAFAFWALGRSAANLDPDVGSLELAYRHIAETLQLVESVEADDSLLDPLKRFSVGPGMYCELQGIQYVSEFLLPNFYFHIGISYAILRMLDVPIGKADYMNFLLPCVRRE